MTSQFDHADFMRHPEVWPATVLPVKRWDGSVMETGVVVEGKGARVYLGNLYSGVVTQILIGTAQFEEFDSFEAIVAAGWRVD